MMVMPVGVDRMLNSCYAKRNGNMRGDGDKVFSKDFPKTRRVPLMPEGDNEMGNHLMTKWCTEASVCVVFENGLDLRFVDCPNLTCATTLPLYGKGHY